MPVPSSATYSTAAKIAAQTSFRDLLDSGPSNALLRIRDSNDLLLAQIPLNDPCGTVGVDGVLTLDITNAEDISADNNGVAAYGEFCDSTGVPHLSMPTVQGTSAVPGNLVLNSLNVVLGGPVILLSAVIG